MCLNHMPAVDRVGVLVTRKTSGDPAQVLAVEFDEIAAFFLGDLCPSRSRIAR